MGDVLIADEHLALRRLDEAGNGAERCRFAAAGRAEEREEFALFYLDVDVVQRGEVTEFDDDVIEPDHSGIPSSLLQGLWVVGGYFRKIRSMASRGGSPYRISR